MSLASSLSAASGSQHCASISVQKHLIVLVHGYLGNDKEMGYVQEALEREATLSPSEGIVVYSASSNVGRTTDVSFVGWQYCTLCLGCAGSVACFRLTYSLQGIVAGGSRLAVEVLEKVQSYEPDNVTLSFVGNSLGGLYARYAISKLAQHACIVPKLFCTTATPHLGVSEHTFIPVPKWAEWAIGNTMGPTGRDLFLYSTIVRDMATEEVFLAPLRRFQYRVAYANAFGTDFQVPTSTAAFLSASDTPHYIIDRPTQGSIVLRVETKELATPATTTTTTTTTIATTTDMAASLDGVGWTKVFCDVRRDLPTPSIPNPFASADVALQEAPSVWTSKQLLNTVGRRMTDRFHVPIGHSLMVANSKSDWYSKLNANGRPIMDQLAKELIQKLTEVEQECEAAVHAPGGVQESHPSVS